jgi:hypothetical protein
MSNKKEIGWSGSLLGITTLIFILSKVTQFGICKDWGWIWIFSPIWLPVVIYLALAIAIMITMGFMYVTLFVIEWVFNRPKTRNLGESEKDNSYHISNYPPVKRF